MFNKDDLVDKVSNMTLLQLMRKRDLPEFAVGDYTDFDSYVYNQEDKTVVTLRLTGDMVTMQNIVIAKMKKDPLLSSLTRSSIIFKYASKLGAMIMLQKDYIRRLNEIYGRKERLLEYINSELYSKNPDSYDVAIEKITGIDDMLFMSSKELKVYWGVSRSRISFRPLPRWHYVLSEISAKINMPVSDVYRAAVTYAFSTEVSRPPESIRMFELWINKTLNWYDAKIRRLEEEYYETA